MDKRQVKREQIIYQKYQIKFKIDSRYDYCYI